MPDKRLSELPESTGGATTVGLYGYDTNGESVQVTMEKLVEDTLAATSDGTTGGTASAGSGNQYIELTIDGVTYKVLHDGTI